jgi:hypothetical protein
MNILVIGNGFDLAHGLPTKYGDFLDSVEAVKLFNNGYNKFLENLKNDKKELYKKVLPLENDNRLKEGYVEDLNKYIENNFWIEHFLEIRASKREIGENWIDFETEIGDVLKKLEYSIKPDYVFKKALKNIIFNHKKLIYNNEHHFCKLESFILKNGGNDTMEKKDMIEDWAKEIDKEYLGSKNDSWESEYRDLIKVVISVLEKDLDRLIRAFEIYLSEVVDNIEITSTLGDLKTLFPLNLISFNYTKTFEKIANDHFKKVYYDDEKSEYKNEILYIHGKFDKNNLNTSVDFETNSDNIILGVYEELKDEKNITDNFISFKKYYQRILKNTDNNNYTEGNYKQYRINNKNCNLYIIGHSLDISDNDLLENLILEAKNTTIFYHNKEANKTQIINLIKMLGQKKLLEYRNEGRIVFKKLDEKLTPINDIFS